MQKSYSVLVLSSISSFFFNLYRSGFFLILFAVILALIPAALLLIVLVLYAIAYSLTRSACRWVSRA